MRQVTPTACFSTKAAQPPPPPPPSRPPALGAPPLRDALHAIDQRVDDYISPARLGKAA
jgi:hypothetical protein